MLHLHPAGIAVAVGLASTFTYANSTFRHQVSLRVMSFKKTQTTLPILRDDTGFILSFYLSVCSKKNKHSTDFHRRVAKKALNVSGGTFRVRCSVDHHVPGRKHRVCLLHVQSRGAAQQVVRAVLFCPGCVCVMTCHFCLTSDII